MNANMVEICQLRQLSILRHTPLESHPHFRENYLGELAMFILHKQWSAVRMDRSSDAMQTTCFEKNQSLKLNGMDTKGVKPSAKCERMNMSY